MVMSISDKDAVQSIIYIVARETKLDKLLDFKLHVDNLTEKDSLMLVASSYWIWIVVAVSICCCFCCCCGFILAKSKSKSEFQTDDEY